jgi:hypothetical protein
MKEFKVGDKVKIVKYGGIIFMNKQDPYIQANAPYKNIIEETIGSIIVDPCPEMVGKVGIVDKVNGDRYSLTCIEGKLAWYNEEQLELVMAITVGGAEFTCTEEELEKAKEYFKW